MFIVHFFLFPYLLVGESRTAIPWLSMLANEEKFADVHFLLVARLVSVVAVTVDLPAALPVD